ncbi:MAG TPA: biotin carboxylase [Kineosporiaceae bacterium]
MTAKTDTPRPPVSGISEIRHLFRTNVTPVYVIGAIPFNLLGIDRWVRSVTYVSYYDPWDGGHPRVFSPKARAEHEFSSGEEINNWLLTTPEVRSVMGTVRDGHRPKVAMVFFDEETERICAELGYDLILPPAELRDRLDSKIVTTQLADEADVASVPNVLTTVTTYQELRDAAEAVGLGEDLVVQTPYGDSGKTTFFISSQEDWAEHEEKIIGGEVKVMRRIRHRSVAVEAVITRHGTVVGPFMSELTGYAELTPYRGGWCGNEMFPEVLSPELRSRSSAMVRRLGDRLSREGYRGYFEVDLLLDLDANEVYLGELNPRISGATAITTVTAGAYADIPLFLFHLLEYLGIDYELDVDDVNERWDRLAAADLWSQMVVKHTKPSVELIERAPRTGTYRPGADGRLHFHRPALDWHQLQSDDECFFLRVYGPGEYRWKGADLGIIVTRGRLQFTTDDDEAYRLGIHANHLITSMLAEFRCREITDAPTAHLALAAK